MTKSFLVTALLFAAALSPATSARAGSGAGLNTSSLTGTVAPILVVGIALPAR